MGQILTKDNLPFLVIASTTTLTLGPTFQGKPTRVTVGGQQFKSDSTITLNTATTGANGLDTGTLAADTLYYVYAVNNSNSLALVASTAAPTTGPSGFSAWSEIGRFRTLATGSAIAATSDWLNAKLRSPENSSKESYTPEELINWTSSSRAARWRRAGEKMKITAEAVVDTPSGLLQWNFMPPGYTWSTEITGAANRMPIGKWLASDGSILYSGIMGATTPSSIRFYTSESNAVNATTPIPSGSTFATGDEITIKAEIPIREFAGLFT